MPLTIEQTQIVNAVIERAMQACRYARKHQTFESCDAAYKDGWEVAAEVCEGAIRDHVMRHIEEDLK